MQVMAPAPECHAVSAL